MVAIGRHRLDREIEQQRVAKQPGQAELLGLLQERFGVGYFGCAVLQEGQDVIRRQGIQVQHCHLRAGRNTRQRLQVALPEPVCLAA